MSPIIDARNILYLSEKDIGEDVHIVKEYIIDEENGNRDNIKIIKDFKRPFWITKKFYRRYKDKKESEDIDKTNMYLSSDSKIASTASKYLGIYNPKDDIRIVKKSPYIYGIDVDARTILKKKYLKKYPGPKPPYRVGTFDIEKNVLTDEIIVISLATYDRLRVGVLKSFIKLPQELVEKKFHQLYEKYIPDSDIKNSIKDIVVRVFEDEVDMIKWIFKEANYANIDFLAAWNIKYDIGEILDLLERRGIEPADIFHYDKIPDKYKYFKFIPGKTKKVTEAGREIPINPEEQWHVIRSTTNYYMIDAMSAHRYVRVGGKTVPGGYSLDNILEYEGVAKKLKFDNDDKFKGIEWHIKMIKDRPMEYIIYNVWDVMSMLELDSKTKDLAISVPLLSGVSHFDIFNSGPKKLVDALFFFYLEHKKVLGVKDPTSENNKILGLDGWIITLISQMVDNIGVEVIKQDPTLLTNVITFVYDADAVSSYPSNTMAANVSKDTTHRELVKIDGIDNSLLKYQMVNLIYGLTNSVEFARNMFNLPGLIEINKNVIHQP